MKKLENLFKQKDFNVCKAQKTELGYKTERFIIETPEEAFNWLKECKSNSIKLVHNLWSDNPIITEFKFIDLK